MDESIVLDVGNSALYLIMYLSAPLLLAALVTGFIISVLQAATQIQEQTLAFVPKIVAVLLALLLFGPWIMTKLVDFTSQILGNLYMYIG